MEYINFIGPVNSLSFGNVSVNMLRALYKLDQKICFFPVGNKIELKAFDNIEQDFADWLSDSYNNRFSNLSKNNPTLKMWHFNGAESNIGSNSFLYTFYETDEPTHAEKTICQIQSKTIFSSSHAQKCFSSSGCDNTEYVPIGFDEDFFETGKTYLTDRVLFGLIGKFEKRKHTERIIKLWAKKYGDMPGYQLTCCITNPFFDKDQMSALITKALDGRRYKNINFLPYLETNSEMNELYNAVDINLSGLSGAEGWNLPAFNSTCLGKWSIVLNATSHKDWANAENSILVEPNGKTEIYDDVFFSKGSDFNQGNINTFSDKDFFTAAEEAVSKCKNKNKKGIELKNTFNYNNTIKQILNIIKS